MKKRIIVTMLVGVMLLSNIGVAAHHGNGHSNRGHQNNCGTTQNYYHCEGHEAHLHQNGNCPYATNTAKKAVTADTTIKSIQQKLNDLGHDCGVADGIMGRKTKSAIKAFQKVKGLTVNGIADVDTKKALGL